MSATRILLEGWPGAGKSTLARRLAHRLRETGIPVCGFVTQEIREGGRRRGFSLEPLGGERGVLDTLKRRSAIKTLRLTRANRDDLPKGGGGPPAERPMKHLYLLRHAKSSWKGTGLPDHDRPLAGRGRRAAKAIARHLRDHGIEPELVLCSTARRARETLERIEPALGSSAVLVERDLYAANAPALLERLRSVPDTVESVMLIGHNPGLQDLALDLARPSPTARELSAKYPTAALATLAFGASNWQEIDHETVELVALVRPRDLAGRTG